MTFLSIWESEVRYEHDLGLNKGCGTKGKSIIRARPIVDVGRTGECMRLCATTARRETTRFMNRPTPLG